MKRIVEQYWFLPKMVGISGDSKKVLFVVLWKDTVCSFVTSADLKECRVADSYSIALPFAPSTFDAVLVLDLLWSNRGSDQCIAGLGREISDLLKPEGVLVLGVEGFLGYLWAHYLESYDRAIRDGSIYQGLTTHRRKNWWINTLRSHFVLRDNYYVYPSLRKPSLLLTTPALFRNVGNMWLLRPVLSGWKGLVLRGLARAGLLEYFSSSLTVWEKKQMVSIAPCGLRPSSINRRLLAEFFSELGSRNGKDWPPEEIEMVIYTGKPKKVSERSFVILTVSNKPIAVVKFSQQTDRKLDAEQHALTTVHNLLAVSSLRKSLPTWWFGSDGMFVYEYRPGSSLDILLSSYIRFPFRYGSMRRLLRLATSWLVKFHQAVLGAISPALLDYDRDLGLRPGPIHGDYQPANILIGPGGELSIVDWEQF